MFSVSVDEDDGPKRDDSYEQFIALIVERWNSSATCAAVDAVEDLLETEQEDLAPLIRAICQLSPYWTEQIASGLLGIENEESGDFTALGKALETATQEFADVEEE
jgi:hypothetical protein